MALSGWYLHSTVQVEFAPGSAGVVELFQDGVSLGVVSAADSRPVSLESVAQTLLRVQGAEGEPVLERIRYC